MTMSNAERTSVQACVFDAYGTVFDTAAAAERCADALGDQTQALGQLWRDKQLQYTWLRTVQNRHADFWQVSAEALDFALATFRISDPAVRERMMRENLALPPFAEAGAALGRVRAAGLKMAILSNGTPAMLAAIVNGAGFASFFDHVLSVEEVGAYKPSPKVYQLACDRLGVPAEAILFVSSNGWDAWAASAFGMRVAWCNRKRSACERLPGAPDHEIASLAELPGLLTLPPAG